MKLKPETVKIILGLAPIPIIFATLSYTGALDRAKNALMDLRFKARGELLVDESKILPIEDPAGTAPQEEVFGEKAAGPRKPKVVYVDFDQMALSSPLAGERPWDRKFFAKVARILLDERVGARSIGYDFIFSSKAMSKMVPEENQFDSDYKIAELIQQHPKKVVLGATYSKVSQEFLNHNIDSNPPLIYRPEYKEELDFSHPEAPAYPMIHYNGDQRYGRLGILLYDVAMSKGAIPRWVPLHFPYQGDAHAKLQMLAMKFAYPIEQKKEAAQRKIKDAEERFKEAQNGHTRLQASIQKKQLLLKELEENEPQGILQALDKIKELETEVEEKSAVVAQLLQSIQANPAAAPALQPRLQTIIAEKDAAQAKLDKLKKGIDEALVQDLENSKAKFQDLEAKKPTNPVEAHAHLEGLRNQHAEKSTTINGLLQSLRANPAAAATIQKALQPAIAEREALENQIKEAESKVGPTFLEKIAGLKSNIADLEANEPQDSLANLRKVGAAEAEFHKRKNTVEELLKAIQATPAAAPALQPKVQENIQARDAAEKELADLKAATLAPLEKKVSEAQAALDRLKATATANPAVAESLKPAITANETTIAKESAPLEKLRAELDNASLLLSLHDLEKEVKDATDALKQIQAAADANPAAAAAFQAGIDANTAKKQKAEEALAKAKADIAANELIAGFPESLKAREDAHKKDLAQWESQKKEAQAKYAGFLQASTIEHKKAGKDWDAAYKAASEKLKTLEGQATNTLQALKDEWNAQVTTLQNDIFKLEAQSEASALRIANAKKELDYANLDNASLSKATEDRSNITFKLNDEGTHWQLLGENQKVLNTVPTKLDTDHFYSLSVALILSAYGLDWDACKVTKDRLVISDGKREIVNAPLYGGQALEINWHSQWKDAPEDIHARDMLTSYRDAKLHAKFFGAAKTAIVGGVKRAFREEVSLDQVAERMLGVGIPRSSVDVYEKVLPKLSAHDGAEDLEKYYDLVMTIMAELYRKSIPPLIGSELNPHCSIIDVFNYADFFLDDGTRTAMESYEENIAKIDSAVAGLQKQVDAEPALEAQAAPLFEQAASDKATLVNTKRDFDRATEFFAHFKDSIVLVGPVDPTFQDLSPTPFDNGPVPKVGVHGNLIKTMLTGNYIKRPPEWLEYFILFLLSFLAILLGVYSGPMESLARPLSIVMTIGYVGVAFFVFMQHHLVLPIASPFLSSVSCIFVGLAVKLIIEEKAKGRIKGMFGSYVSADLVEQMVESGEEPSLGGEEQRITAFFSDVQSFSAFSEKLTPTGLVDLMNEYLTAMTDILQEEKGTLDKYIGDAIVAMYGAPIPIPDHAYLGVRTAVRMQMRQIELRAKWKSEGDKWPDIVSLMQTRIGLNTGTATVGNMGALNRFNYTMMGDMVNLAARSESGAKAYGAYIMITEDTYRAASENHKDIAYRYLDKIVVKGRTQPVEMYEVTGFWEYLDGDAKGCLELFQQGIDNYLKQNWDEAEKLFLKSKELEPNKPGITPGVKDNPSMILIDRVRAMRENPPGDDWDGVYIMTSK